MDLIILNDGLYQLVPVTKTMMEHMSLLVKEINCFDLCDILRLKLTTYHDYPINTHVMKDGSGDFIGCICKQFIFTTCCDFTVDLEFRKTYPKEGKTWGQVLWLRRTSPITKFSHNVKSCLQECNKT